MSRFLNLDKMVPTPDTVMMGGKEWKVSADLTVGEVLALMKKFQDIQESENENVAVKTLVEQIHKFFKTHQPDLTVEELSNVLKIHHIGTLITWVYEGVMEAGGNESEEDDEEEAGATKNEKKATQEKTPKSQ